MPGNFSQLSYLCVDSPLQNKNNTPNCLSSWFESNLCNRSQYVVYNNNSIIIIHPIFTHNNDLTHSSKNIITIICDKFTSTNRRLQLYLAVKWKSFRTSHGPCLLPTESVKKKKKKKKKISGNNFPGIASQFAMYFQPFATHLFSWIAIAAMQAKRTFIYTDRQSTNYIHPRRSDIRSIYPRQAWLGQAGQHWALSVLQSLFNREATHTYIAHYRRWVSTVTF